MKKKILFIFPLLPAYNMIDKNLVLRLNVPTKKKKLTENRTYNHRVYTPIAP